MKRRLLKGFVALILVFGLSAVFLSAGVVQSVARDQLLQRLQEESLLIKRQIAGRDAKEALAQLISTSRVTLIAQDGGVLFDSWADSPLGNHMDRPEIIAAQQGGTGSAIRYSDTTRSTAAYAATQLPDGSILRVAAPERVARAIAAGVAPYMVFGLLLILIITIFFANFLGDKLLRPILSIDLDHPEDARVYEEVLPLIRRIDQQNRHNKEQMEALDNKRLELNTLIFGMQEGFVALGAQEEVILINPAACSMLGLSQEEAIGKPLLEINRSKALQDLLGALHATGSAEGVMEAGGRHVQLLANRIAGRRDAVLLLSDQTYKIEGEDMRRRFTANVSHELRTPLTTILGYAELLDQGLNDPKDAAQLHQKIHQESRRMLRLVEDILRLSRLDEGQMDSPKARINLASIAKEACHSLEPSAQDMGLQLDCQVEEAWVLGDATLLFELCANLIDNAIKYNVAGGKVQVQVTGGSQALLSVSDTGIGIEPVHQARVFERFYRTDTSRSKQTGGTGLGLSIVKHAAEHHKAKVSLQSQPGKGTRVSVLFPACQEQG